MNHAPARPALCAGAALLALGLLTGCGASAGSTAAPPDPGPASLPTSSAAAGSAGGVDAAVCAAVASDVAAVTTNVSTPSAFPGQCAFGGGATTVTFNVDDPQHSGVTDVIGAGGHTIGGFGEGAEWYDGDGGFAPSLGAWKGSVSCLVQPDSAVQNDMIAYTGKPPLVKISDTDAAAYAQKLGAICNDVFAAAGG